MDRQYVVAHTGGAWNLARRGPSGCRSRHALVDRGTVVSLNPRDGSKPLRRRLFKPMAVCWVTLPTSTPVGVLVLHVVRQWPENSRLRASFENASTESRTVRGEAGCQLFPSGRHLGHQTRAVGPLLPVPPAVDPAGQTEPVEQLSNQHQGPLVSMAIEKCTLLAIEKCTLWESPRGGSGATGAGALDGTGTPFTTLLPRCGRAPQRPPGRRSGGWPWRVRRGGASGSCCLGC